MYFFLLVAGVALWSAAHLFKRIAPDARANMGDRGKGVVALALLASVVLMVIGFRGAAFVHVWTPPTWATHINNLLMLISLYLFAAGDTKASLTRKMRHPMLTGFIIWAAAHSFVNGDVASLILFGGLGVWAIAEIIVINRAEPDWTPNPKGTIAKDGMFLVASVVLVGVIGYIHGMIGPSPFG